jgi:hypothetical protein
LATVYRFACALDVSVAWLLGDPAARVSWDD